MIPASRMAFVILMSCSLAAAAPPAKEAEKPTCAVLPFSVHPRVRGIVSSDDVQVLTDRYSAELTRLGCFRIVDQDYRDAVRNRGGSANAQKYVKGTIGLVGETFTINTRVVNASNGIVELQIFTDFKGSLDHLLTVALKENAEALLLALDEQEPKGKTPSRSPSC